MASTPVILYNDSNTPTLHPTVISSEIPARFTSTSTATPTRAPQKTNTPCPTPKPLILQCSNTGSSEGSRVTCKIPRAYCSFQADVSGDPTFCNDARYPGHNFTLVVWGSDWSDFDGKCIVVTGLLTLYSGKPQIKASSRSQISNCPLELE